MHRQEPLSLPFLTKQTRQRLHIFTVLPTQKDSQNKQGQKFELRTVITIVPRQPLFTYFIKEEKHMGLTWD